MSVGIKFGNRVLANRIISGKRFAMFVRDRTVNYC